MSVLFWVGPAIRNWKSSLFPLFLFFASHDLIVLLIKALSGIVIDTSFSIFLLTLVIYYLLNVFKLKRKVIFVYILALILISVIFWQYANLTIKLTVLIAQIIVLLLLVLKKFAEMSIEKNAYSLFYIVLIFYFLTLILKYISIFIGTEHAVEYFIVTTIFQILFGLFFSIFREDDPRLLVKLE